MAGSINKVILIGNVGRDPEGRSTQAGARVVNFTLETSESWTDKRSGERIERTEWHRVVIWNEKLGEIVEKYVHKGDKIYVEGALATRKWTDDKGVERTATEVLLAAYHGVITMLSSRRDAQGAAPASAAATSPAVAPRDAFDDAIPF